MTNPAPTPQEKALKRVLLISWLDGWSLVVIASLGCVLTLLMGELLGTFVGLLILAAGVLELRGRRALRRRQADGMKQLVRAQLFLLTVILVYCARCLGSFDAGYLKDQLIPELRQNLLALGTNLDETLKQFDLTIDELVPLVHKAFWLLYGGVAVVSLLFQGGLALYYRGKTRLVTEALAAPPAQDFPPS